MIQDGDYILTPCGQLGGRTAVYQGGKMIGDFSETDLALGYIRLHMDLKLYWPNIWWESDHGNCWQIDAFGNEVRDHELEDHC